VSVNVQARPGKLEFECAQQPVVFRVHVNLEKIRREADTHVAKSVVLDR
jgi:hypothetical protein